MNATTGAFSSAAYKEFSAENDAEFLHPVQKSAKQGSVEPCFCFL
jgi:hypothetical protein